MKRFTLLMTTMLLCAGGMSLRAETVSHAFGDMAAKEQIAFTEYNTVGTTDFVTYTCSNCDFGGSPISIRLLETNDSFVISPALNNLKSIKLGYTSSKSLDHRNFKVCVSEDGIEWGDGLTSTNLTSGSITYSIPAGYYFIKIQGLKSPGASIWLIEYEFDDCPSCFTYVF